MFFQGEIIQSERFSQTRCGVVVIVAAQRLSIKPELRFYAGSNTLYGVLEISDGKIIWQWLTS